MILSSLLLFPSYRGGMKDRLAVCWNLRLLLLGCRAERTVPIASAPADPQGGRSMRLTGEFGALLPHALSDRARAVLCPLAQGKAVSPIADKLAFSVKTVRTYRACLLDNSIW